MKRTTLIAGTALIAVALTSVSVAAHQRGDGDKRGKHRIEAMLERFDANGDGAITKQEIEAAGVERFNSADADGNGLVTAEEMAAAADKEVSERMTKRISKHIERADTNGDGSLSLEEATASQGDRTEKMFERFDTDADGTITQAELEAGKGMFKRGKRGKNGADDS